MVELELVDGRRTVLDISFDDVAEVYEVFDTDRTPHVELSLRGRNDKMILNCSLSSFMRIMGEEYVPWSKTVMENELENGR